MSVRLWAPALTTVALLTGATAAHAATPTLLPPRSTAVTSAATTSAGCAVPGKGSRGTATATYRAPMSGYLTTALRGRGDWDLALLDGAGRPLGSSQGFRAEEVVQAWVTAGERISAIACRRRGAARTARIAFRLADVERPQAPAGKLLRVRGTREQIVALERTGLDVTESRGPGWVDVIVSGAEDQAKLAASGLSSTVRHADLGKLNARNRAADARFTARVGQRGSALPSGRTSYRVLSDYQTELKALAEDHPTLVKPLVIGTTYQGREIAGVEIAKDVKGDDGRPVYFLMGMHHAREWPSAESAMEFATMMATQAQDPRIAKILETSRVVVVPIVNVDGFVASRGAVDPVDTLFGGDSGPNVDGIGLTLVEAVAPPGGVFAYRRKNCNGELSPSLPCELAWGVDNNRNYGKAWGGPGASADVTSQSYHGPGPRSEPETQAVWNYARTHHATTLITLHTVAALVLRPPGVHDGGQAPDEERMKLLGDAMGAAAGYESQYGFQLYDTAGTTEDDTYAATGGYGYTIEIGPPGGEFHMPYETGVVNEWTGQNAHANGKGGLRELLLLGAEAAGSTPDHAVLTGHAPAGQVLRVKRAFTTTTSAFCGKGIEPLVTLGPETVCPDGGSDPIELSDEIDATTTVPAKGKYEWHVNPSTRPFVLKGEQSAESTPVATLKGSGPQAPTSVEDLPFAVTPEQAGDTLTVAMSSPGDLEDYDLEVLKVEGDGSQTPVGSSGVFGAGETVMVKSPQPGNYIARVTYYAAFTGEYQIDVTSQRTTTGPGGTEAYTLTCEDPDGTVRESHSVVISRGQTVRFNLGCGKRTTESPTTDPGPWTTPGAGGSGTVPPPSVNGKPVPVAAPPTGAATGQGTPFPGTSPASPARPTAPRTARVAITVGRTPRVSRKTGRLGVKVRCPKLKVRCRGKVLLRGRVSGKKVTTLGRRSFVISSGRSRTVSVYVTRSARRALTRGRKLRVRVSVSGTAGATRLSASRLVTVR
ncbi:M14 family zinc carboxypeptidase [Paraconexibacter sp.]|uniref:M14 family zinc carboxypeptidase n=1 Tax=Paraconexibacter sp. TaxID=2949640 RepID=UPI003561A827